MFGILVGKWSVTQSVSGRDVISNALGTAVGNAVGKEDNILGSVNIFGRSVDRRPTSSDNRKIYLYNPPSQERVR